ncbi:hypothetical protein ELS24_10145 [Achromobacter spanius]|uniref:hypothetical protein n=1 Tax=Achromobacter spanius TaxID=217203 RepID=UPI000F8F9C98|nr:hypothetical protein [Achromobacter spanius]AZS78772.1 hypothetical protein ELS24_10145 [Achromobacter spanius]
MGLTVHQSHEDDFAKIVRTDTGRQVLYYADSNEEGEPQVIAVTSVEGITVRVGMTFKDSDSGHDKRDKFFGQVSPEHASKFEAMAIGAVVGRRAE